MSESECTTLENIMTVACEEFLQKGFQGASLRNIVRKAGVTTGAFYGYFKSKEDLFDSLVKEQYLHILEMYQTTLENFQKMMPDEQRWRSIPFPKCSTWPIISTIISVRLN